MGHEMNVVVEESDKTDGCSDTMSLFSPTESVSAARVSMDSSRVSTGSTSTSRVSIDSTWSIGGLRRNCVQQLRLQYDVTELRNRIAKAESANDDLRKQLKKKEQEVRHMEEQVRSINDRMHSVHKGEEENKEDIVNLTRRCKELQRDKQELQRQLEQRESLYQSLLNQCRAQDGKLAESSELRVLNKVLLQQVEDLKQAQQTENSNDSINQRLRQELERCKKQNQEQKQQIVKLQRDNGSVADTLAKGLQNIQDLRVHNHELEKQLRRDSQRAALQLEQERLAHTKEIRELKEELQCKQLRMEEFEKSSLEQRTRMDKLIQEQEERVHALVSENSENAQRMESEYNETIDRMQAKLDERNNVISSLQDEVSRYMQEVMALTTNLDESQVQNMLVEDQNATIAELEQHRTTLRETLRSRDLSLAEMGARLTKLEVDNESLVSQQRISLERHQREMESHKSLTASIQQGLRQSLSALQSESETVRQQLESALDTSNAAIASLEEEVAQLQVKTAQLQSVISTNEGTIQSLGAELAKATEMLSLETNNKTEMEQQCEHLKVEMANMKQWCEDKGREYGESLMRQEERVKTLEKELQEQLATKLALVNARDALDEILVSRDEAIAEMSSCLADMELERESLVQQQREALESHQRELYSQKQAASAAEKALQRESETTRRQLQQALDESLARVETLKAQVTTQDEVILQLRETQVTISSKDEAIHSLQADITKLTETLAAEASNKSKMETELDALKAELTAARERFEDDISAYGDILSQHEQQVQILESELRQQAAARNALLEERDTLNEIVVTRNCSISDLTTRLAKLEQEQESKSELLAAKDTAIAEMAIRLDTREFELNSKTREVAERELEITEFTSRTASLETELAARNATIAEMTNRATSLVLDKESIGQQQRLENERHQRAMDSRNKLAAAVETGLRETISVVKKDSDNTCRQLKQALDSLEAQAASQKKIMESLQLELLLVTQKLENAEKCQADLEQERSSLKSELLDARHHNETETAKYREASAFAEKRIQNLLKELDDAKAQEGKEALLRNELDNLNVELERVRTKLAIKEDEIRDLTLIDLRESEDLIAMLKAKVKASEDERKRSQSDLAECKALLESHKQQLLSVTAERHQMFAKHQTSINELQAQIASREYEFRSQEAKLLELETAHASLSRKNSLLIQRESSLREERSQLLALEKDWKIERAKLEKQEENLRSQVQILKVQLSETEENMKLEKKRIAEVEETLGDRTQVLGKVVDYNKVLESDLVTEKAHSKSVDEALARLQEALAEKEEEASRLRKDLRRKHDQFEENVHQERMLREIAEADLKALKSQLDNERQDSKIICDLQKENVELLDKVKRQEAMIKRKLEKDKALRNRLAYLTNSKDTPTIKTSTRDPMTTPARGGSSALKPARGVNTSVKIAQGENRSIMSDVSSVSHEDFWESESFS